MMDVHTCDTIRDALHFIPADDRDTWLRMGMAIKSELGEGGFELWDEWSRTADNYNAKNARTVWKSIKANGKVTAGTLFHEAKAHGWRDDGTYRKPTPEELEAQRRIAAERAAKEEAEIASERAEAAKKAAAIWKAATRANTDHPYLSRKRVSPVATLREIDASSATAILGYVPKSNGDPLAGRLLVVPVKTRDALSTLELIDGDGRKAALAGRDTKAGGYWAAQSLPDGDGDGLTLLTGEGVATVLSAKEASGHPSIAALSAGNLPAVAKAMRERYPAAELVILADLVKATGKPDQHAVDAALAVGGLLAVPDFGDDRPEHATDFNDMGAHCGLEAVRAAIANSKSPARGEPQPDAANATAGAEVIFRCLADVRARPIAWLWPGRIARGKVTMLAGHPGLGKSQVTVSMAAVVTTGGKWPVDRTPCERGAVIILSAEDDAEDTIRPRLEAAGADLTRVYILDTIREHRKDGTLATRTFNLAVDIERLGDLAGKLGDVALIVIDPITAYLGGVDSHKNAEVRGLLAPLAAMAAELGAAVVCVSHLTKAGGSEAMLRVMGSLGFVAASRAAYLVAKDPDDDRRRLFLPMKNNIAEDTGGLAFRVRGHELGGGIVTSRVEWDAEPVTITADEAMTPQGDPEERSELEDCKEFLRGLLSDGPVTSKQVKADADGAGHAWRTIRRAADSMGVLREKSGMKGGWVWKMPSKVSKSAEGVQVNSVDTFGENGHLREEQTAGVPEERETFTL